jgi:prepilin-type N-terminal cleavage/methylation domain-containing protein
MRVRERGFTYIELVVAMTIMVLIAAAAAAAIFQIFRGTERNNNHITTVRQVQTAGYWISRDAQMAQTITADNLTLPNFLILSWTEWDYDDEPTYHTATYLLEDLTGGIGKLKRIHWSSAGANEEALIAQYIYYEPGDSDETSQASYQNPVLSVRLTSLFEETSETREYRIKHRTNL